MFLYSSFQRSSSNLLYGGGPKKNKGAVIEIPEPTVNPIVLKAWNIINDFEAQAVSAEQTSGRGKLTDVYAS